MLAQYKDGKFRELCGLIEFSDAVFQSAESLTASQRAEFSVYQLVDVFPELPPDSVWAESWAYEISGSSINRFWTAVPMTAEQLEARRVANVPQMVSPRQLRQALTRLGLRAAVENAVANGSMDTKDWYEFSLSFDRNNVEVNNMATALGVSARNVDDLWTLAGSL
jgi:hypothetical protein